MATIDVDYLLVGAGAVGMAFLDTLVAETDATVLVVDRGDAPGGHWNAVYPFVRLHQPSAYYGVNSAPLGSGRIDADGDNAGLYELASGDEIRTHFAEAMRRAVATGRVQYLPSAEYDGGRRVRLLGGRGIEVTVRRRVVDATHSGVVVPSMRPPNFDVAEGVACVPPNRLPTHAARHDRYVVLGGGKTGMDSVLWLLRRGVPAQRIAWVKPREAWLLDRSHIQPGPEFANRLRGAFATRFDALTTATSLPDLFRRLEAAGSLLRVDTAVEPTMYRCATVTRAEVDALRTVRAVLRGGYVTALDATGMTLQQGRVALGGTPLYVDCTAEGLVGGPTTEIFADDRITLQCVRSCQQIFSAAFIAHVEAAYADDDTRNALCRPVPLPSKPVDWLTMTIIENRNQQRWIADPALQEWLHACRLDVLHEVMAPIMSRPERVRERALAAMGFSLREADAAMVSLVRDAGITHVGLEELAEPAFS